LHEKERERDRERKREKRRGEFRTGNSREEPTGTEK
jgi:hypothetical protein